MHVDRATIADVNQLVNFKRNRNLIYYEFNIQRFFNFTLCNKLKKTMFF